MYSFICEINFHDYVSPQNGFSAVRAPSWSKILFAKRHLPSCDWLFWTDADSIITNFDTRLETFIDENYNFIITKDINGMNGGHWFIKNTPWSYEFLDDVWAQESRIDHVWWEQQAIMDVYDKYKEKIKIVPNKLFNAYPDSWEEGDFLIHFPGPALQAWGAEKHELMEKWKSRVRNQ